MKIFTTIRRVEGEFDYLQSFHHYFKKVDLYEFTGCLVFQNNSKYRAMGSGPRIIIER